MTLYHMLKMGEQHLITQEVSEDATVFVTTFFATW
jgi:hypothetical protein